MNRRYRESREYEAGYMAGIGDRCKSIWPELLAVALLAFTAGYIAGGIA